MINMEIEPEDCVIVLRTTGIVEVYCAKDITAPNVILAHALLNAIAHSMTSPDDVARVLAEINENIQINTEKTDLRVLH